MSLKSTLRSAAFTAAMVFCSAIVFAGANPPNISVQWLGTVGPDIFGRTFKQWEISYVYGDDWTNTSWWRVTDANGNAERNNNSPKARKPSQCRDGFHFT